MIGWLVFAGYMAMVLGTTRWMFGRLYRDDLRYYKAKGYSREKCREGAADEPKVFVSGMGGAFWPITLVVFLVVRPICRTVCPVIGRWFTAPARRADQEVLG